MGISCRLFKSSQIQSDNVSQIIFLRPIIRQTIQQFYPAEFMKVKFYGSIVLLDTTSKLITKRGIMPCGNMVLLTGRILFFYLSSIISIAQFIVLCRKTRKGTNHSESTVSILAVCSSYAVSTCNYFDTRQSVNSEFSKL